MDRFKGWGFFQLSLYIGLCNRFLLLLSLRRLFGNLVCSLNYVSLHRRLRGEEF